MRLIKLSKDVYGFDTVEACIAYFKHVLPWQKFRFNIVGEGNHISSSNFDKNETIVFSYRGRIIAIGIAEKPIIEDQRVDAIILDGSKLKIFDKVINLGDLETKLNAKGYDKAIINSQGWNILEGKFEKETIDFLMKAEWADFVQ